MSRATTQNLGPFLWLRRVNGLYAHAYAGGRKSICGNAVFNDSREVYEAPDGAKCQRCERELRARRML